MLFNNNCLFYKLRIVFYNSRKSSKLSVNMGHKPDLSADLYIDYFNGACLISHHVIFQKTTLSSHSCCS